VSRAAVGGPVVKLATITLDTQRNNIDVDADVDPKNLYVRDATGDIHAIVNPGLASFAHIGAISTRGESADFAMAFDKTNGTLVFFETESITAGAIVRMQ
jgi:hypothetical protein